MPYNYESFISSFAVTYELARLFSADFEAGKIVIGSRQRMITKRRCCVLASLVSCSVSPKFDSEGWR
jgi:hypothetical protein